jgi:hypothetical protein
LLNLLNTNILVHSCFFYQFDQQLQEELKCLPFLLQNQIDYNVNSPEETESDPRQAAGATAGDQVRKTVDYTPSAVMCKYLLRS